MRSYGQYCALARALDVVGERWTLLIIRELFSGDCRYSDLRDALPGIATNLLAERLRQLQAHGLVESYDAARPVRATVYRLTDRGRELGPALRGLVAFGSRLVAEQGQDAFRTHWLTLGLPALFDGAAVADLAPLTVWVDTGDQPAVLEVSADGVSMRIAEADAADVTVAGEPDAVFAMLTGTAHSEQPAGMQISGQGEAVDRLHRLAGRSRLAGH
ncbi:MAG: helix-turn-helix transcriptional regulator [Actinomycetota bacterium]|nr:helix-turn-helix transcriptional regulator [Actinomycetota bacterium]